MNSPVCIQQRDLWPPSARHELSERDPSAIRGGRHRADHPHCMAGLADLTPHRRVRTGA